MAGVKRELDLASVRKFRFPQRTEEPLERNLCPCLSNEANLEEPRSEEAGGEMKSGKAGKRTRKSLLDSACVKQCF